MSAEGNLRKSKRQHVPNPIYSQGISQLKKESNIRHKKKTKNAEDDLPSYSEEKNEHYQYSVPLTPPPVVDSKDPFLFCVMPQGNTMNVQFLVQPRQKEEEKKNEVKIAPVAPPKPKKQAANLLSLFQKAIEDADIKQDPSQEENSVKQPQNYEIPKPPPIQRPKRVKNMSEGSIQKIVVESGEMKIQHSVLGGVSIPVDWEEPVKMENEKEESELSEMRKKLRECKLIQNISILMA